MGLDITITGLTKSEYEEWKNISPRLKDKIEVLPLFDEFEAYPLKCLKTKIYKISNEWITKETLLNFLKNNKCENSNGYDNLIKKIQKTGLDYWFIDVW